MARNRETVRVPMVVSCWSDANKARRDRPQSIVSLACFSISHDIGSAIASPPPVSKTRRHRSSARTGGRTAIVVMKAAEDGRGTDGAHAQDGAKDRSVFADGRLEHIASFKVSSKPTNGSQGLSDVARKPKKAIIPSYRRWVR